MGIFDIESFTPPVDWKRYNVEVPNGMPITFYQSNPYLKPELAVFDNPHGDEYKILHPLAKCLKNYRLTPFLYCPNLSPTSLAHKRRTNEWNHDQARFYFPDSPDPEARVVMDFLQDFGPFQMCLEFHEDNEYWNYFYLIGNTYNLKFLRRIQVETRRRSILHDGIDETNDPCLGYRVRKGVVKIPHYKIPSDCKDLSSWMFNNNLIEEKGRYMLIEQPMNPEKLTGHSLTEEEEFQIRYDLIDVVMQNAVIRNRHN